MSLQDSSEDDLVLISAQLYEHIVFNHPLHSTEVFNYTWRLVKLTREGFEHVRAIEDSELKHFLAKYPQLKRSDEIHFLSRFKLCQNCKLAYQYLRTNHVQGLPTN